ncbi:MAG: aminomethyltransferase family protein [Planctomycetes bacterium]|nr:aminomethyltransferase family protein [Planctomycetota bacterium]
MASARSHRYQLTRCTLAGKSLEALAKNSPLLSHHRAAGAELSLGATPFALSFGEVPDEYAAAQTTAVVFDATERDLVCVTGSDAAAFLQRLLANTVRTLAPGQGNRNLLLSSKGKVLFDFDLSVREAQIRMSLPPACGAAFAKALDTYHFSEKLAIRDDSAQHAPLALCGPSTARIVREVVGVELPREDHASVSGRFGEREIDVTALPVAGSAGARIDGGPELALALWNAVCVSGARPAGRVAYDCLRVEAGWAEPGVDVDDSVYPQEARLERGFALDKGCYIGQEVVAKIDTYGGLNKRLVALRVSHDDPLPRGARLFGEDEGEWRDLGVITSWAYSFVLDTGLVLAYVKRRHQACGTRFRIGDPQAPLGEAVVVALPVRSGALAPTGEFE